MFDTGAAVVLVRGEEGEGWRCEGWEEEEEVELERDSWSIR